MVAGTAFAIACSAALGEAVTFSSTGTGAANLTPGVDAFRAVAGTPVNAPGPGPVTSGRREINWDANAMDAFASPVRLPNNFTNNNSMRGAVFVTGGDGFLVSQRAGQAGFTNARFGEVDPSCGSEFQTFSAERLFAAKNSTVMGVCFFVPSSPTTPATVSSFGAVFADVNSDADTFLEFFDLAGDLLHRAIASPQDKGLSFVGTAFDAGERIARVRIHAGNTPMGTGIVDAGSTDVVVLDDFAYSEPIEVPAPEAAAPIAAARLRRRR